MLQKPVLGFVAALVLFASFPDSMLDMPAEIDREFTVVLDPGHFNLDADGKLTRDGAHAEWEGRTVWEGEVTLAVSEFLRAELEGSGITVYATRTSENKYWRIGSKGYDQEAANVGRAEFANGHNADLYLRIHFDGSPDPSASGFAVYYNDQSDFDDDGGIEEASRAWAEDFAGEMEKRWPLQFTGVKTFERTIYGFKYAKVPSVLVEGGFMTNRGDLSVIMNLESQELLAEILADVIARRIEGAQSDNS